MSAGWGSPGAVRVRRQVLGAIGLGAAAFLATSMPDTGTRKACVRVLHDAGHSTMNLSGADYSHGAWSFEDTGRVFGYAAEEDSTVWTTRACAASQPA